MKYVSEATNRGEKNPQLPPRPPALSELLSLDRIPEQVLDSYNEQATEVYNKQALKRCPNC